MPASRIDNGDGNSAVSRRGVCRRGHSALSHDISHFLRTICRDPKSHCVIKRTVLRLLYSANYRITAHTAFNRNLVVLLTIDHQDG
ncbi:MAG: hypothetical protein ACK556_20070, partial [Pseudanabaena sp.]